MNPFMKLFIGMLGGLLAAISKYGAFEHEALIEIIRMHTAESDEARAFRLAFYLSSLLLVLMGGAIAWAAEENNRLKLIAIGAAAPALVAPWTAQTEKGRADRPVASLSLPFVSPAIAQTPGIAASDNARALRFLLGIGPDESQRYWVIVGSHRSYDVAAAQAQAINRADSNLQAFVGAQKPGNPFYPVIVGGPKAFLPLNEARNLLNAARQNRYVEPSAYLSDYPGRLAEPVARPPSER